MTINREDSNRSSMVLTLESSDYAGLGDYTNRWVRMYRHLTQYLTSAKLTYHPSPRRQRHVASSVPWAYNGQNRSKNGKVRRKVRTW